MNSFWWPHVGSNSRGINWMSWVKLSMHKNYGDMGVKDQSTFNLAMLGKQGSKFVFEPNVLFPIFLKPCTFLQKAISRPPWVIILPMFDVIFFVLDLLFMVDHNGV